MKKRFGRAIKIKINSENIYLKSTKDKKKKLNKNMKKKLQE